MINKTLTSLLTSNTDQSIFYRINDTFLVNSEIYFSCPLTTLNVLLSSSISSVNIQSYKLYVRICDSISGSSPQNIRFSSIFNLSTSNISNNSITINLSSITNKISQDYLCDNMTSDEIFSLYKNFKIIFRIYENDLNNENIILANDIVQDLNIVLNTAENGPYDVNIKELDFLSPSDFTSTEIFDIYTNKPYFLGKERLRIFYPENIERSSKCPLFLHSHGMGQFTDAYDLYLSALASYGYVALSMTTLPVGFQGDPLLFLGLIDHIKQYETIIDSGFFTNLINFEKINFSGHSRGGASAFAASQYLKNKSFIQTIQNFTINFSNLKSLISFADAHVGSLFENKFASFGVTFDSSLTENELKYYDSYIDVPMFLFKGTTDSDSSPTWLNGFRGCTSEYKRNKHDIINISIENYAHGEIAIPPLIVDQAASNVLATSSLTFPLAETYTVYNTQISKLNEVKSELIIFLSIQNFNSKKLKKLYYQDINLLDKKILKNKQSALHRQIDEEYNNIKYALDYFQGITLSYAGSTGMTFSSIGFTYGYAIDSNLLSNNLNSSVYDNAVKSKKIPNYSGKDPIFTGANVGLQLQDNDDFNGIINLYDRCLLLPIESNFALGYTFSNGLTFDENDYLYLRGALKVIFPRNIGNTMNAYFSISLYDSSNNISTISSKTSNQYFTPPYNEFAYGKTDYDDYINFSHPTFVDNVYFRAGDFYLNNPSLNLNNIRQILLNFGPSYGSTFAHLVLDEFVVTKSL